MRNAVALLEPAREVPVDVRAELTEDQDGEGGRADAVDVVVTVDADPLAASHSASDRLARSGHVPEQERIVAGRLAGQERSCRRRIREPAPDEDARGRLAELELVSK